MSVQSQVDRIEKNIANTYSVLEGAGAEMPQARNTDNLAKTAASISAVLYGIAQPLTEEQKAQARANIGARSVVTPQDYGAKCDGVTNDTTAFQNALANNRIVTVPGGTYVLSDTLVIRENCCLELSQDTVLQFTQTSGNCIEMRGSAVLRGNHAVISAAFGLTGNVISMDTLQDGTNHASIPPYAKADPQWKRQRFVYDVNIIKPNSSGFNRPLADGICRGTAIYMSATNVPTGTDNPDNADISFMWGITLSGIRIAGGFSYGIHAVNYDTPAGSSGHYAGDAWNHDMRIEAVIEGCEIGVCLENCNGAHLNVTVQPNTSNPGGTKYAKQGVCLKDSRFVDMMRSRVWDWHVARNDSAEYQHLALYGNCKGLILDDFLVHENSSIDIRDQIYTDTPSNFDTMTILQEPGNKWFKNVDGVPKFFDGTSDKTLMLKTDKFTAEQAEFILPAEGYYTNEPDFTNLVDGYSDGYYLGSDGTVKPVADTYTTTDFISIDSTATHTYRIGGEGITWQDAYGYGRIAWYDSDKKSLGVTAWNKIGTNEYYPAWVEDENVESAFATLPTQSIHNKAAYFRITAKGSGADLIVTIDEPQTYTVIWHGEPKRLDESIHTVTDWNAAEGEVGHVLNRTHYEYTETVFPETALAADEDGTMIVETEVAIDDGDTCTVYWNGVPYVCKANLMIDEYGEAFITLGNRAVMGMADTGEPFFVGCAPGILMAMDMTGSAQATLKIEKTVVKTIPEQFFPAGTFRQYVDCAMESNSSTEKTAVAADGTTVGQIITWVTSGIDVVVKLHEEVTVGYTVDLYHVTGYGVKEIEAQQMYTIRLDASLGKWLVLMATPESFAETATFLYMSNAN